MQRPYATTDFHADSSIGEYTAEDLRYGETVRVEAPPYEAAFDTDRFVKISVVAARAIEQDYAAVGQYQQLVDGDERRVTLRKPAEELRDAAWSLENAPLALGHPDSKLVTDADDVRGFVRGVEWDAADEALTANVYVPTNDDEAIEWVGENDHVSLGFFFDLDAEAGGVDGAQRNLLFDHLAVVDEGRCSREDGCGLGIDGAVGLDAVLADSSHHQEGSWVKWGYSGGTAYGKVVAVKIDDGATVSVEGGSRTVSNGEPVYKLRHWDDNDEEWGNMVVKSHSELKSWSDAPSDAPALDADGCTPGPCRCGCHTTLTDAQIDAEVGDEDIDLVPPEAAQDAAQTVLDYREEYGADGVEGMRETGWNRAEQLASGEELSPSDLVSGTDAMSPWWSRHVGDLLVDTDDGYEIDREEDTPPHKDNSNVAALGWGGVAGYKWAIETGNEIHEARGKEQPYSLDEAGVDDDHAQRAYNSEAQADNDGVRIATADTQINMANTTVTIGVDDDVVETLSEQFEEVADLAADAAETQEQLEAAQDRIDDLEDELAEYRNDEKRDVIDEITAHTDYWDEDELLEADLDTLEERLQIVESSANDAAVSTPETDEASVGADEADSETDYDQGETYDLSETA